MITDKTTRHVEEHGVLDQAAYHIDEAAMGHITSILSNMYSDPPLAVVREYFSNAVDAHTAAGKPDVPVEVKLPTLSEPTLVVRDYGNGLTVEQTKNLLGGYGASGDDKRTSNDMIGGFGIGAKVGFSVSSAFNYTIYHDGRKRIWSCYLDEHDRGRMSLLHDEVSTEPTGIEITIPVAESWIKGFQRATDTAFLFARVPPKLRGLARDHTSSIAITAPVGGHDLRLNIDGTDVRIRIQVLESIVNTQSEDSDAYFRIVIGSAGYAIDLQKLGLSELKRVEAARVLRHIRIEAPIGFVQVAPSREALQYSQRTIKVLRALMEALLTPKIGMGIVSSVVGVTPAKADISALSAFSLVMCQLYGVKYNKEVLAASGTRYAGWLESSGTLNGLIPTLPDTVLAGIADTTSGAASCALVAIKIGTNTNSYQATSPWRIDTVQPAVVLASKHLENKNLKIFGCIVPKQDSLHSALKRLAAIAAGRHKECIKAGLSTDETVYALAWVIGPELRTKYDSTLLASPFVREAVVEMLPQPITMALELIGSPCVSIYGDGEYYMGDGMREAYRSRRAQRVARSNGPSHVVAHSRKFVVPSHTYGDTPDKASDLWEPARAVDVKDSNPIFIPLDEFRVVHPAGINMISRDIHDNQLFIHQLLHPQITDVLEEHIPGHKLVGIRIADVPSLGSSCHNFWKVCQELYTGALQEPDFADALLVHLSLDSKSLGFNAFIRLMQFVTARNIQLPWSGPAARWAAALRRAEASTQADVGLFKLATACFTLSEYDMQWKDQSVGVSNNILGDVGQSCFSTVTTCFTCCDEKSDAESSKHVLTRLWYDIVQAHPMLPYIIPWMTDYCGHGNPFNCRCTAQLDSPDIRSAPRRCYVTFEKMTMGEEYLEQYLRLMPPVTKDFAVPNTKKQKP